jgi:hypothetical protein
LNLGRDEDYACGQYLKLGHIMQHRSDIRGCIVDRHSLIAGSIWVTEGTCGLVALIIQIHTPLPCSGYCDWIQAGRPRDRSSSPGSVKNYLFLISSAPALGPTKLPIQWISGALSPGVKRQEREAHPNLSLILPYVLMAQCLISYAEV